MLAIHANYQQQSFVGQTLNLLLFPIFAQDLQKTQDDTLTEEELMNSLIGFGVEMVGEETQAIHFSAHVELGCLSDKHARL